MNGLLKYLLLFCFMACGATVSAQSKEELQEMIRKAEAEIKAANELLEKTRRDQKASENELKIIRTRINNRQEMVKTLGQQLEVINRDISEKSTSIGKLGSQLENIKKEYAEMIYSAYKNYKLNNALLFVFSAEDFNQATRRINFMRRYNRMREEKAAQIKTWTDSIVSEVTRLDETRRELDQTKESRNNEISTLAKDEGQYKTAVDRLKNEQSKIAREVQAKQEEIEKAQRRVQELIAEEARKNQQTKTTATAAEERQIVELSGRFEQNKGRLPYPIRGGVVTDKFGQHAHSVVKTTKIENIGVHIAGEKGAEVRCVFDGTVSGIYNASVFNNCIIVRHGDYVTVYSNVVTVSVKTGDKVTTNQRLGRLSDSADPDTHFLHFAVLENGGYVNPEHWISR